MTFHCIWKVRREKIRIDGLFVGWGLVKCPVIFCYFVSSRPGRPPKRSPLMGITSPQHDVLMKMKKPRLDNGDYNMPYENGHNTGTYDRLNKNNRLIRRTRGSYRPKYCSALCWRRFHIKFPLPLLLPP